ncbi:MAG TPA: adenylyl-sulfate kinase [Actinomycetes bacterium]|nr:adenylyl-sulfate kinase [Actinomycetes bacterium]
MSPPPKQHTLHGSDLSWVHLILDGVIGPEFTITDADLAPVIGDRVDLLDPEGVTVAQLTITSVDGADGSELTGTVEPRSGFTLVDHLDLRATPDAVRSRWRNAPVWALWAESPVPFAVRDAVRTAARNADAQVAEIVPLPTGRETSRTANAPVRLARAETTRDKDDHIVVVPWPDVPWDATGVKLRARIAAAYGGTDLLVTDPQWESLDTVIPVRAVDVPAERRSIDPALLDQWVLHGDRLPEWAAEPAVADELLAVHRPASRRGMTVLLSGLSGSGKSTVARALAVRLVEHESRSVSLLDGDVVRHHLSKGLGFSRPDRITNVLRIGFVASEITKAGGIAVCCPIAPYDETRSQVRAMVEEHGVFVLVHVATPLAECERRDRKGLYAKARRGEIPEFTGISDPYETPTDAEVVIDTTGRSIDECVDVVYRHLVDTGIVAAN